MFLGHPELMVTGVFVMFLQIGHVCRSFEDSFVFIRALFLTQDLLHHSYGGRTGWDQLLCLHGVHHQALVPGILY